ncbi:MAG: GAF and ANTAR domain-containing protein [Pseudarthrobacter sp.]|nr:GAF and ANTAR domain-containing protein [Pseudarthrobacter sp.]
MTAGPGTSDAERLYALVGAGDLRGFLEGMCAVAADVMYRACGTLTEAAVAVDRRKRRTISGGSGVNAARLEGIVRGLGQEGAAEAFRRQIPAFVTKGIAGPQRPGPLPPASGECCTVLGIPLHLGPEATGVLGFFGPATGVFGDAVVAKAVEFADTASCALQVALKVAAAEELATDLRAALASRTTIDVACGIILATNRCSSDRAFDILSRASNNRNEKLCDLAQELITRTTGAPVRTAHFDD